MSINRLVPTFLVALFLAASTIVHAQDVAAPNMDEFYTYGDSHFIELTTLPSTVANHGRAIVDFRLTYDLLTFRRVDDSFSRGAGRYVSTPTMYVEAVGSDGVISDRGLWRDTVRVMEFSRTNDKHSFAAGSVDLSLRPGVYTIRYTLENGSPDGEFSEQIGPFKMDDFGAPSPAIGRLLFLRRIDGDTLTAASIDGNAPFGHPIAAYVPIGANSRPERLHYRIIDEKANDGRGGEVASGFATLYGQATLSEPIIDGDDVRFVVRYRPNQSDSASDGSSAGIPPRGYGALVDAPAPSLEPGDYLMVLELSAGQGSVTDSVRFSLQWFDRPVMLTNTAFAIRALYPIATEETISRLLRGSPEEQRRALNEFWKQHDPTPTTAYNEAMAEYYRRADYALFNFRSITQNDGVHTDRGKVYLLFGPPTEVRRQMKPEESPRVVWIYRNRVNSEFVFVDDDRSGAFRLVQRRDL